MGNRDRCMHVIQMLIIVIALCVRLSLWGLTPVLNLQGTYKGPAGEVYSKLSNAQENQSSPGTGPTGLILFTGRIHCLVRPWSGPSWDIWVDLQSSAYSQEIWRQWQWNVVSQVHQPPQLPQQIMQVPTPLQAPSTQPAPVQQNSPSLNIQQVISFLTPPPAQASAADLFKALQGLMDQDILGQAMKTCRVVPSPTFSQASEPNFEIYDPANRMITLPEDTISPISTQTTHSNPSTTTTLSTQVSPTVVNISTNALPDHVSLEGVASIQRSQDTDPVESYTTSTMPLNPPSPPSTLISTDLST